MAKEKSPKRAPDSGKVIKKNTSPKEAASSKAKAEKPSSGSELESLQRQELVEIASSLKIKNYSRLSKAELVKMITQVSSEAKKTNAEIEKKPLKKSTPVPIADLSGEKKFEAPARNDGNEMVLDNDKNLSLEDLSRQELVDIAQEMKIKNYSRLNKTRLIKLISEARDIKTPAKTAKKKAVVVEAPAQKTSAPLIEKSPETESEEQDSAGLIERIAQHLKSPYVDEREAKSVEDHKLKFLLKPSKFPKGKTNKEYLLEEEENLELPEIYEENKIVLLPVDPFRIYTYWNLNIETLGLIEKLNLQQIVLKVNDVTGIVYNGKNANHYWFESCIPLAKNWYIYLQDGNRNLMVELGYVQNGKFNILATSNTIYVPRKNPSQFVQDKFVIVNYPETAPKKEKVAFRLPSGKTGSFYRYDDESIAESFNTRRLSSKMPVFTINDDIPGHFVKEYEITGPVAGSNFQSEKLSPPQKLPGTPPVPMVTRNVVNNAPSERPQQQPVRETIVRNNALIRTTMEEIPQTIREQFEYFSNIPGGKVLVDRYYYEIPGQEQKIIKVSYQWFENSVPFSKEFYWTSDSVPQIHEKIYKVSWGPTWVKEYIGGSEHIRFIGASERFLGGSEMFMGGSERYIGGSEFLGSSEFYLGGSDIYMGGSERYIGGSERFLGGSERTFAGGSEMYIGGSEQFLGASEMSLQGI